MTTRRHHGKDGHPSGNKDQRARADTWHSCGRKKVYILAKKKVYSFHSGNE